MSCIHAVTGATGKTGRVIAERLLSAGHTVRVVGRNAERLQPLVGKGAIAFVGGVEDAGLLAEAYNGADAVYAIIPPNPVSSDYAAEADRISKAHVTAIRDAGVEYVVALSSIGAHRPDGVGIAGVLYHFEQDLAGLEGVNVLSLRPTYFMDNVYAQEQLIKALGFMGGPVVGGVSMPVVHTRDVGAVAAARMADRKFSGHSFEYILGPRDVSYDEIARVIGRAIGKQDLKYIQFPPDQAMVGLQQFGFSENVARLIVELAESTNNGILLESCERTQENTTPTSIEEFAEEFARLYNR